MEWFLLSLVILFLPFLINAAFVWRERRRAGDRLESRSSGVASGGLGAWAAGYGLGGSDLDGADGFDGTGDGDGGGDGGE